ncbi:YybH family protein [Novosphingobium tardum]|uniref:YybH family protein n=1 Tax=Novosphingobium tardum TaxID=1538021 RepID=A0ABV8RQU2_9SPHN
MHRQVFRGLALTIVPTLAALGGCTPPAAPPPAAIIDTAKIADAVKGDVGQLVTTFNAHDAAMTVAHDAPDYVGMFHGAPNVVGPEQDLAVTKRQVSDPAAKVAVSDEVVDVAKSGEMAVYRATYAFTFTDPKSKAVVTEPGNWILGYKVQADGTWKMAWSVVSNTGDAR